MRTMPNKTILEGQVTRVDRAPDGWGADVEFTVERSQPAKGFPDFLQVEPGASLTIFAAEPDAVQPGRSYTLTTSVVGGPHGERVVVESARAKG